MPGKRMFARTFNSRGHRRCKRELFKVIAQVSHAFYESSSIRSDIAAALSAHFLKRQRVEMLQLRDIQHFLTEVMQEGIDGCIYSRTIYPSWQDIAERSPKCRHRLNRILKWMSEHLFEGQMNTRYISETSLSDQHSSEFSIDIVIVPSETLFRTLDRTGKSSLQVVLVEYALD